MPAIKVPFAVVIVALLSRASALSSAARFVTQRGPLGLSSRHLACQSVRAALANPLWRPAQPLGRSRRLLCSGGAPEPPPPARPPGRSLAHSAGLERPHVDLLPISEEWKERLRSLTRPAASAMVRRLDAASPLCYRLDTAKDKDKAGVRDPLQLAAFAGDVERVSKLLLEREGEALPSAMKKKLRGTAQAFLEARAAAEEAAAADGAAQP